ncbi:hypothetical protein BC941DRAFT_431768 [Chlamydoabsidia padenii]|nr:hypothetical protein BC941DRAFT_431768 [Chlamydoabsidia padenii]
MTLLRILKNKGSLFVVVFIFSAIFFLSALLPSSSSSSSKNDTTSTKQALITRNEYSRIKDDSKRRLLYSALGHIRIGYVANRTPDVDTPPLLVMYSCKSSEMQCGGLGKRLVDMAHGYFFSMLVDGTAFTVDMSDPVSFQIYFEATPGYMALQPSQAYYYLDQLDKANEKDDKVRNLTMQTMSLDPDTNYIDHFKPTTRILQTTHWPVDSISSTFQVSSTMKQLRDQYRLGELVDSSQWFWVFNRLLLNPTDWLASQLAPHRLLMGGSIQLGDSLSWQDPRHQLDSPWFRIGLRLDNDDDDDNGTVDCWRGYVEGLCAASKKEQCHLFVSSATSSSLLHQVKQWSSLTVHAVDTSFPLTTIGQQQQPSDTIKKNLFESDEQYLKTAYARPIMDWVILSRMDYLLGSQGDNFIKTAAWAAQVQTDLLTDTSSCLIKPMVEW